MELWITYRVVHEKAAELTGAGIAVLMAAEVMVGLGASDPDPGGVFMALDGFSEGTRSVVGAKEVGRLVDRSPVEVAVTDAEGFTEGAPVQAGVAAWRFAMLIAFRGQESGCGKVNASTLKAALKF